MIRAYFVSQGKNYDTEREGGYIIAPKSRADGAERSYWTNITKVNAGDLIIHYATGIKAVSQAKSECTRIKFTDEHALANDWSKDGFKLECDYFDLKKSMSISKFKEEIMKHGRDSLSAFNVNGNVKNGYLFELNPILAAIFLDRAMKENPKLETVSVVEKFLNQEYDTDTINGLAQKSKKEIAQADIKMTNQMLSNLERLMALHDSTHLVKPASYKANLPEKYKKEITVDEGVIPKESVSELIDTVLRKYLETGKVTEDEVYDMRFIDYSSSTFGIDHPLLMRVKALTFEDSPRYFKQPVTINNEQYYICKEWTEDQRELVENFLSKIQNRIGSTN